MNGTFVAVPPPYDLVPSVLHYPLYHVQAPSILSWISDKDLSLLAPIAVYWVASAVFEALDAAQLPFLEKYRIHEPEEVKRKNRVTKRTVFIAVIVQQVLQTLLGMYWLDAEDEGPASGKAHRAVMATYGAWISRIAFALLGPEKGTTLLRWKGQEMVSFSYWWLIPALQFLWASFVLDTWQYFWHRYFHTNKFLYKHIHSLHHRLYCPYAFGALYNHPVEGFILDSFGTAFAHWASLMTTRQAVLLFSFSTLKTVDDHCGFALPFDPLQVLFGNNVAYHDIHHQQFGIKKNFSQPYFTHWDTILSTRMTPEQVPERHREKYRAGPVREVLEKVKAAAEAVVPQALKEE